MTHIVASKRVLIVDDEPHIIHVVALKLRNAGFDVVTASDGEEAMEVAAKMMPDLVITDYQMPFMSGLEFCQQLKANPRTAEVPALMLTARGFTIEQAELDRTNIVGVLSKPFSPREVLMKVHQILKVDVVRTA